MSNVQPCYGRFELTLLIPFATSGWAFADSSVRAESPYTHTQIVGKAFDAVRHPAHGALGDFSRGGVNEA